METEEILLIMIKENVDDSKFFTASVGQPGSAVVEIYDRNLIDGGGMDLDHDALYIVNPSHHAYLGKILIAPSTLKLVDKFDKSRMTLINRNLNVFHVKAIKNILIWMIQRY